MALETSGGDETADKNSRAIVIVIGAFNDLPVYRYAGLVRKVAFSTGSRNRCCREPVGIAIRQTGYQIGGSGWIVEILNAYLVDHYVRRIPGALVDAVSGNGWVRAGTPKKEEIGRMEVCRQHHPGQSG